MLSGERCGGAGGLAMSRPGDAGGKWDAKRGEKKEEYTGQSRERGGSEKRAEWSCSAVAGVMRRRPPE